MGAPLIMQFRFFKTVNPKQAMKKNRIHVFLKEIFKINIHLNIQNIILKWGFLVLSNCKNDTAFFALKF